MISDDKCVTYASGHVSWASSVELPDIYFPTFPTQIY